jgi:hypothetical protein
MDDMIEVLEKNVLMNWFCRKNRQSFFVQDLKAYNTLIFFNIYK